MPLYSYHPVANGLRTDHPIPDLPFVEDGHIPVDDPDAVEAIGRGKGEGMHGREDRLATGGWVAFTTDPVRPELGWVVRWHPEHGRSVVLYRSSEDAGVHTLLAFQDRAALLFRAGGYKWDGTTWYRPGQIWDGAGERYYMRAVPAAVTVTAADWLQGGDAGPGRLWDITELDLDAALPARWRDDLALWASHHDGDLGRSVVTLVAPELSADQLVGVAEMAEIADIAASTLRAYVARGENDVPLPQAAINGRGMWARPVAEDWAEKRRRSRDGLAESVAADKDHAALSTGGAEVWRRFAQIFFSDLWSPQGRKRWALRWRTEPAVRQIAESLSFDVAIDVPNIVPVYDLASTVRLAVLHEFASGKKNHDDLIQEESRYHQDYQFFGLLPATARMLDWLVRHDPSAAASAIHEIIGEAERELEITRQVSERSIATALMLDGALPDEARQDFLERVLTPESHR